MSEQHPTLLLGAYVLDTLGPAERHEVDEHLQRCRTCAKELDELWPLRDLLSQLGLADLEHLEDAAGERAPTASAAQDLFVRVSTAAETTDAAAAPMPRPYPRRLAPPRGPRLLVAAAVVLLTVGAALLGIWAAGGDHHASVTAATSTASAGADSIRMTVVLAGANPGTVLRVTVAGLPVKEHCTLIAVARDGSRHAAGRWVATYSGDATVTSSTDVPLSQLHQLVLLGTDGHTLVSVNV